MTKRSLNGKYPRPGTIYDVLSVIVSKGALMFNDDRNLTSKNILEILSKDAVRIATKKIYPKDYPCGISDWAYHIEDRAFPDYKFYKILRYLEYRSERPDFVKVIINSEILEIISQNDFSFIWLAELIVMREDLFILDKKDIVDFLYDKDLYYLYSYTRSMHILGISPPPEIVVSYAQVNRNIGDYVAPDTFYLEPQEDSWYEKILTVIKQNPELDGDGISMIFSKAPERNRREYQELEYEKIFPTH